MATVERYISYYGDGAVLDSARGLDSISYDDDGPTAVVRVVMPQVDYLRVWHYTRKDNCGPEPFADAYDVAQFVALTATETDVISCDVCEDESNDWGKRLPCYLCGHHEHNPED